MLRDISHAAKKQLEKIARLDFNRPSEHLKIIVEQFKYH